MSNSDKWDNCLRSCRHSFKISCGNSSSYKHCFNQDVWIRSIPTPIVESQANESNNFLKSNKRVRSEYKILCTNEKSYVKMSSFGHQWIPRVFTVNLFSNDKTDFVSLSHQGILQPLNNYEYSSLPLLIYSWSQIEVQCFFYCICRVCLIECLISINKP